MRSLDKRRAAARYHRAAVQGETYLSQEPATPEFAPDPELGNVVVVKESVQNAAIVGVMLLALGGGMIIAAIAGGSSRSSSGGSAVTGQWALSIVGTLMVVGGALVFRNAGDKHVFYESGAAMYRKDRRLKRLRYAEADELLMRQVRMYHNGVYTGTSVTLKWSKDGKPIFSYSGTYKEIRRKGGLLTLLNQTFFDGPTELDPVRDFAASAMAPKFVEALSRGEPLELGGRHSANSMGMTPASGAMKGQYVPYHAIENMQVSNFNLHVMSGGEEIITCPTNGKNFWPKFYAVQAFWRAALVASGQVSAEPTPE